MTTASDPGEFRYQWAIDGLAHLQPLFWLAGAGVSLWTALIGDLGYISVALTLALLVSIFAGWKHSRSLCERCAKNTPLDTDAAIERDGHWLQWAHWHADHVRKATLIFLGLIILESVPIKLLSLMTEVALNVLLGALVYCHLKHRVLQPWCPWCRWDGGGDEEASPVPTPPSVHADR